jgi:hypothetical protein
MSSPSVSLPLISSMKTNLLYSNLTYFSTARLLYPVFIQTTLKRTFASRMSTAKEFPPEQVRAIVSEVASLLKERKESVSVAETVSPDSHRCFLPSTEGSWLVALHHSLRKFRRLLVLVRFFLSLRHKV